MPVTLKNITCLAIFALIFVGATRLTTTLVVGQACSTYVKACAVPTCADSTLVYRSALISEKKCGLNSGIGGAGYSGIYNCHTPEPIPDPSNPVCNKGSGSNERACWRYKTCEEIDANFPKEYDFRDREGWIFEPDDAGNAGPNGYRCGRFTAVSPLWWQAVRGNIYGEAGIENEELPDDSTCTQTRFVLAKAKLNAPITDVKGSQVGLQLSEDPDRLTDPTYWRTERDTPNTYTAPAHLGNNSQVQSIDYFKNLINYPDLSAKSCQVNGLTEITSDGAASYACVAKPTAALDEVRLSTIVGSIGETDAIIAAGQKIVIFVAGSLRIDSPLTVEQNGFIAFLVEKEIVFDNTFGNERDDDSGTQHLDGVFIANGKISFDRRIIRDETWEEKWKNFNEKPYCDKEAILNGTFASLSDGNDIELTRTFKACFLLDANSGAATDWNCRKPATTITYRPDLLINVPEWMKQNSNIRLEVI